MNIFGLFQNFAQENTRDVNKDANTSTDTGYLSSKGDTSLSNVNAEIYDIDPDDMNMIILEIEKTHHRERLQFSFRHSCCR